MTRGEFDPDMNGGNENGREIWREGGNPQPEDRLIPPDLLEAGMERSDNVEHDADDPYPGEPPRDKPTDPDEWHH